MNAPEAFELFKIPEGKKKYFRPFNFPFLESNTKKTKNSLIQEYLLFSLRTIL